MALTKDIGSLRPNLLTGIGMRLLVLWRFMEPLSEDGDHHHVAAWCRRYAFAPSKVDLHCFAAILSFATFSLSPEIGQRRCRV